MSDTQVEMTQEEKDAEAAFAQGFSKAVAAADITPPPAPEPTPEPTPEPAPPVADPMASLPEEVRAALGQIPILTTRIAELSRTAGMVPTLQSQIDRLTNAMPAPPPPPEPKFDKVDALRAADGLPEVADAIEQVTRHAREQIDGMREQISKMTPPPPAPAPTQTAQAVSLDPDEQLLDRDVPDWRSVGASKEFHDWVKKQPDGTEIAKTTSPLKFATAVGRFKEAKAHQSVVADITAQRHARAAAAVAPNGANAPAPAEQTTDQAFAAGFNKGRPRR